MRKSTAHKSSAMKQGGKVKKYAMGGAMSGRAMPMGVPDEIGRERAAAMRGRAMPPTGRPMKKGGKVKCMAKGGGCETRGKTKGKMI
jgi:hypothetical protein